MTREKICGIYKITNKINGKIYIGKSIDIHERWDVHKSSLNNNSHHNIHLQRAWNKNSGENFIFKIIEIIEDSCLLNEREKYWIEYYNSFKNGYNRTLGGDGILGVKLSRDQIISSKNTKPIYQINLSDGKIIKEWYGAREVENVLKFDQVCIWECCNKKRKTYKGFVWIFIEEYDCEKFNTDEYKNVKNTPKEVVQISIDGEVIKVWKNATEINKQLGFDVSCICKVCNGKLKHHKGFSWKWKSS